MVLLPKGKYMNGIHHTVEGAYRVSVVDDKSGQVVWEQPELQKNLILNQGLDALYSTYYADTMLFAVAGTGTRLNYIDPAGSMLSQTGTTVTLIPTGSGTGLNHLTESFGSYSTALQAGDVIRYSVGSGSITDVTVIAVADLTASVTPSLTISPSQSFTIWKTSQTLMQNEIKRSGTYLGGTGNCGLTQTSGINTIFRTYDFTTESISRNYSEIGVSWSATTASANIFSRVVLPSPVLVDVGQRLRVYYQLAITLNPASGSPRPNVTVTGWPVSPSTNTNATESVQNQLTSFVNVSDGATVFSSATLDPNTIGSICSIWISNASQSLSAVGTSTSRQGQSPSAVFVSTTKLAYTNGSYTCDKTGTFTAASIDISNIRSIGLGNGSTSAWSSTAVASTLLFDQSQVKTNTQTLTLSWRWTWGRTISN